MNDITLSLEGIDMLQYETDNYVFYYREDSYAEKDILKIAYMQQSCFNHICNVLKTKPNFKIEYFLCKTADEVGKIYGDNEPCNGFTSLPNKIYAVYNRKIKCIGFHEDAHIISYTINRPDCPAIREGLAMYFDRKWWSINNLDWVGYFLKEDKFIPIEKLLNKEAFFAEDCSVTYPIMGAFTEWLVSSYGMDRFIAVYREKDTIKAMESVYNKKAEELNRAFVDYANLFEIDEALIKRMSALFGKAMQS